jgi:hypothetical protein
MREAVTALIKDFQHNHNQRTIVCAQTGGNTQIFTGIAFSLSLLRCLLFSLCSNVSVLYSCRIDLSFFFIAFFAITL